MYHFMLLYRFYLALLMYDYFYYYYMHSKKKVTGLK